MTEVYLHCNCDKIDEGLSCFQLSNYQAFSLKYSIGSKHRTFLEKNTLLYYILYAMGTSINVSNRENYEMNTKNISATFENYKGTTYIYLKNISHYNECFSTKCLI